ncbi:MAG: DUF4292 domain-containing protein [Bacteroidia bacterium]|jgi:hypothetical protein|nr:DUF4292 domain-containing protein [Bacteroidia bacterium]
MRLLKIIFAVLVGVSVFASCKSIKPTVQNNSVKDTVTFVENVAIQTHLSKIATQSLIPDFFQAKGTFTFSESQKSQQADITIMVEKDKYIWASVTAVLGIEAVRILITPDSIKLINRIQKEYLATDFSKVSSLLQAPLSFKQFQSLLYGIAMLQQSVQKSVADSTSGGFVIYTRSDVSKQTAFYSNEYKLLQQVLEFSNTQRKMDVKYDAYTKVNEFFLPSELNINIKAEKNLTSTIILQNFVLDKKREPLFNIPSGYEKINTQ